MNLPLVAVFLIAVGYCIRSTRMSWRGLFLVALNGFLVLAFLYGIQLAQEIREAKLENLPVGKDDVIEAWLGRICVDLLVIYSGLMILWLFPAAGKKS